MSADPKVFIGELMRLEREHQAKRDALIRTAVVETVSMGTIDGTAVIGGVRGMFGWRGVLQREVVQVIVDMAAESAQAHLATLPTAAD